MHPDPRFAWEDREAMLGFLADVAFCTICVEGPAVVHAPVVVAPPDRLSFHISRANRVAKALEGARDASAPALALVSCLGPDAYISPDWYGTPDQVPTWNYVAVEAEGPLRRLERDELVGLLDDLGAAHEARLAPKPPWTRAKMNVTRFDGLLKAVVGFEMQIEALRGTRKLGQHKQADERAGAAAGLAPFNADLAGLMAEAKP